MWRSVSLGPKWNMSSPNRNKYPKGGGHLSPGMFQPLLEKRSDHLCRLKEYWYYLGDGSYSKSCQTRSALNAFDDQRTVAGLAGFHGAGPPEPPPCLSLTGPAPGQTLALETSLRAATCFIHAPPYVKNHLAQKGEDTIKILNWFFLTRQKSWPLTSLTPPMLKNDNSSWSHIPNDNSMTAEKDPSIQVLAWYRSKSEVWTEFSN